MELSREWAQHGIFLQNEASTVLNDSRFASLFKNTDFQIDHESEEYTLVRPIISGEDKKLEKKTARQLEEVQVRQLISVFAASYISFLNNCHVEIAVY